MGSVRFRTVDVGPDTVAVEEIHKVVVHKFRMGDVEDPDLYAAEPLLQWQNSSAGKYVMKHAIETPIWHRHVDPMNYGYQYIIVAELEKKKLSEYYLRFDKLKI
jgi:hypothetical protein